MPDLYRMERALRDMADLLSLDFDAALIEAFTTLPAREVFGGEGSGNFGHAGRPGEVGGSAPGGGGGDGDSITPKKHWTDTLPDVNESSPLETRAELVRQVAKKYGIYNEMDEKIKFAEHGYQFEVDGLQMTAAGQYNPRADEITLYHDAFTDKNAAVGVVVHEIQHKRFQRAMNDFEKEKQRIRAYQSDLIKNGENETYDKHFKVTDELRPDSGLRPAYPAYDRFYKYDWIYNDELRKKDGVSGYSKLYWNEYETAFKNATVNKSIYDRAVNETLAEVERLTVQGKTKGIPEIWRKYNADVKEYYKEMGK